MQMPNLSKAQRIILISLAVAVAIVQIIVFESEGIEGIGWIFSFVVIAGALFVAFGSPSESSGRAPQTAAERFNQVLRRMEKKYVHEIKGDPLASLVAKDERYGCIVPFAFAFTVFRFAQSNPSFLISHERRMLFELAANKMVDARLAASKAINNAMPLPPGSGLSFGPTRQEAIAQAAIALNQAIELISTAGILRHEIEAEKNLSTWISQKLKMSIAEGAACLKMA